ncbi:MAG: HlyC/CorC family transporter [Clostridiales bacterium]|nr:HlyC/CorC family transporter [Clostridiales bacterium]
MGEPGFDTSLLLQLMGLFILILLNAFFAMGEIAIISLNDNKIAKMAEEGHKKAKQVVKLTENSSRFLSTIQIGITLAGFLASASASRTFVDRLSWLIMKIPHIGEQAHGFVSVFAMVVITVIVSYFSLVLGELAPKHIALQAPEKIAFATVDVILFISKVTKPFVKFLAFSTNTVVKLFGFDPNASQKTVTEEEIRMLVDVGGERGVIEADQKEMINNIFEFDDVDVSSIMTHRTNIFAVEEKDPLLEVISIAIEKGYSRIPVYREDLDDIIGLVYVKDLLKYIGNKLPGGNIPKELIRQAYYIPETKLCWELFKDMTASHVQMAVVVDEYGGTAGLVTMEDLLEFIVGNIQDEYDNEGEEISKIDDTTFTIDGITLIDEVEDLLGLDFPEGEYDTLAGFIISLLGFLPQDGEMNEVLYKNLRLTVLTVEDRRIDKVRVEILAEEDVLPQEGDR